MLRNECKGSIMQRRAFVLSVMVLVLAAFGVSVVVGQGGPTNVVIVMDSSGSMRQPVASGQLRVDVAKESIAALAAELPADINVSLWAYGHRLPQDDVAASCQDIEAIIPLGPPDAGTIAQTVYGLDAIGYTPIAATLTQVAATLSPEDQNIIVLMSDGEESCGGDPCAVAAALAGQGIDLRVNTIGFAADAITRQQLQCIADVTGGTYFDAADGDALLNSLREASEPETGLIQLVYASGAPADELSFSVVDPTAVALESSAVGSAAVPAGEYVVRVDTLPVFEAPAVVTAGQTTIVEVPDAGAVQIVDAGGVLIGNAPFSLTLPDGSATGPTQIAQAAVLPGSYTVRVDVVPAVEESITVEAGAVTQVMVGAAGTVQVVDASGMPVEQVPLTFFNPEGQALRGLVQVDPPVSVQPGEYTVRVMTSPPFEQAIAVAAGEVTSVTIGGSGTLQVVSAEGDVITDYTVTVKDSEGTALRGLVRVDPPLELQAGEYIVEVASDPVITQPVTITGGQVTSVQLGGNGTLLITDVDGNPVTDYTVTVKDSEGTSLRGLVRVEPPLELQAGAYIVEVDSQPIISQMVTIGGGQVTAIQLPGAGTIQVADPDGNPITDYTVTVKDIEGTSLRGLVRVEPPLELQAGDYIVEVNSQPIITQTVTVSSGVVTSIGIPGTGTIQVVDETGNPTTEFTVTVRDSEGTSLRGLVRVDLPVDVQAGDYLVEVEDGSRTEYAVTVVAGEAVVVQIGSAN
jgi:methionine-rich copper-binding protein CopC